MLLRYVLSECMNWNDTPQPLLLLLTVCSDARITLDWFRYLCWFFPSQTPHVHIATKEIYLMCIKMRQRVHCLNQIDFFCCNMHMSYLGGKKPPNTWTSLEKERQREKYLKRTFYFTLLYFTLMNNILTNKNEVFYPKYMLKLLSKTFIEKYS